MFESAERSMPSSSAYQDRYRALRHNTVGLTAEHELHQSPMAMRRHHNQVATPRFGGMDNGLGRELIFDMNRLTDNPIKRSSISDVFQDSAGILRRANVTITAQLPSSARCVPR